MRILTMLLACALFPMNSDARSRCDELACDEVKEDIRNIEAKMRSGYTRAQGEKYQARLRKLKTKRRKICR